MQITLPRTITWAAIWLLMFGLYVTGDVLHVPLIAGEDVGSALVSPFGVFLAVILLYGWRGGLVVLLSVFAAKISGGLGPATALSAAAFSVLEAMLGTIVLRRLLGTRPPLDTPRNVALLLVALLGTGALCGSIDALGTAAKGLSPEMALRWWLADTASGAVLTPLLLTWAKDNPRGDAAEAAILGALAFVAGQIAFAGWTPSAMADAQLAYLPLPFLVWAAVRYGRHGATTVSALVAGVALWGTASGQGPFVAATVGGSFLSLNGYITVMSMTTLVLAALVRERESAQQALRAAYKGLERLVDARTQALTQSNDALQTEVAERIAAERALRASEEKWRAVVETAPDTICTLDRQGRILYINRVSWAEDSQNVVGTDAFAYIAPEDQPVARQALGRVFAGGGPEEFEVRAGARPGSLKRYACHVGGIHDGDTVVAATVVGRDVTARRAAEEALQRSELLLASAQQMAILGSWEWDLASGRVTWSDELYRIFGYEPGAIVPSRDVFLHHIHPDDRDETRQALDAAAQGNASYERVHRLIRLDGGQRVLHGRGRGVYDDSGRLLRLYGSCQDITEVVYAQEALQQSTARWILTIEAAPDGFWVVGTDGILREVNAALCRMLGYAREELIGLHIAALEALESEAEINLHMQKILSEGFDCFETRHRRKDGTLIDLEISVSVADFGKGEVLLCFFRDISRRKVVEHEQKVLIEKLQQTHDQLIQAEKMASLGQLAAGVAHEINNPVGYIGSNLSQLDGYLDDLFAVVPAHAELNNVKQDLRDIVRESREGVDRIRKIVQDLRDFSRVDGGQWEVADLHQGIESTLNIVHNELKYKATIVKRYGKLPLVRCMPSRLNQVFLNLLVNAAHAIPDHGTITITTGGDLHSVWVEVRDTGTGIAPEHRKRLFEPFFTTKPIGKGTGLGLSLSYGIVRKHGGRIEVESEVDQGSAFRVWLPVAPPEALNSPSAQ